jgi:YD repeat-containing protein
MKTIILSSTEHDSLRTALTWFALEFRQARHDLKSRLRACVPFDDDSIAVSLSERDRTVCAVALTQRIASYAKELEAAIALDYDDTALKPGSQKLADLSALLVRFGTEL